MKKLIIILFISISIKSVAQSKSDFSGNWKINPDKTEWNHVPAVMMPVTFSIKQSASDISISRTLNDIADATKQNSFTEILSLNGKGTKTHVDFAHSTKTSSIQWPTGPNDFTINSTSVDDNGNTNPPVTEKWSISPDGKVLTMERILIANGLTYDAKGYYEKQ